MSFAVINVVQRSPEWRAARLGRITGSVASVILAKPSKDKESPRAKLCKRLVVERIFGASQEDAYQSAGMKRGADMEPTIIAAYEAETGHAVRKSGFLQHNELMAGVSLDGHIGAFEGVLEMKRQDEAIHLAAILDANVPANYTAQVQHALWLTNAQWCDFVSFNERFPIHKRVARVRFMRSRFDFDAYEKALRLFLYEVEFEERRVREAIGVAA